MRISRREFLARTAVFSAVGLAPRFLMRAAHAEAVEEPSAGEDRILVVVQLGGGNDGLNTVVPFEDDRYHRARPGIGLAKKQVLPLTEHLGLHERLTGLKSLYDEGRLAIVQGVGYPNPDRSHFRSMEIWHTASDSDEYHSQGWLGRYFDNTCDGFSPPHVGLAVDTELPQAFDGEKGFGIASEQPNTFGWREGPRSDTSEAYRRLHEQCTPQNDTLGFLQHVTTFANAGADEIVRASGRGGVRRTWNARGGDLAQFDIVAGLIRGGLRTRVYYISTTGFDTHANQSNRHAGLLASVGNALQRFQKQLEQDGNADRVMTMVFSEFGRRVAQNASGGTDHGTAAPMFMIGSRVRPGLYGTAPDLDDLDDGDLKFHLDFRHVYAAVLRQWLRTDADVVLKRNYQPLELFSA